MSCYYNFKNVAELRDLLALVFDITSGHHHDGTDSRAVTTATPSAGSVDVTALATDALAATETGRLKMATGYFTAAAVSDKFGTDSFTATEILKLIQDGAFAANSATRALFANGIFTPEKLTAAANTRVLIVPLEDLGAGADIADRVILYAPAGQDITLVSAGVIFDGASAGVDDGNTAVILLEDGSSNAIVTKTYNTGTQPPSAGSIGDLGALDGTYKALAAGEKLMLSVTQGATANLAAGRFQIVYTVATAA